MLVTENRLDAIQIQRSACPVNEGLKDLVHLSTGLKQQVATVFDLETEY
jgi:hypothetical protein